MFFPRLFETLQSLFWSIFGLLNLYVTNVKARHEFTEFVGATMFGTYNVISLVVLLNMLIAMMNNSYQLIAVSHVASFLCPALSQLSASSFVRGSHMALPIFFVALLLVLNDQAALAVDLKKLCKVSLNLSRNKNQNESLR